MFFDSWHDLVRILIVGGLAYVGLVLLLRVTGKRTLSKMNAFDLVVTVALGSTLATVLLSKDVTLTEGLLAFVLLCGLQYVVATASVHSPRFRDLIKAEPSLLFYRGRFLTPALHKERVTEDEVLAAVRSQGKAELGSVEAVILETDGSFSVISGAGDSRADTLRSVHGFADARDAATTT
ncbi:YetF domain-containing protein [Aurantimonas sp. A2-1-M11]|uniref:DUF421 domain-containing protein n=1 Tax=Aurantimonas sp. A2-1-M11 TaxID=3113712 RepID=UPI002F94A722